MRGRKPTPTAVKLATGNPGKRRLNAAEPKPTGDIERPKGMEPAVAKLWDTFIARAFWLRWPDGPKAFMWCSLQAEFEANPSAMNSARIAQLRALGSELGMDPAARSRLSVEANPRESKFGDLLRLGEDNPAERYFQ